MFDTSSKAVLERSLALKILNPMYVDSMRALVAEVGPDKAAQTITPHSYHGAIAGAMHLRQMGIVEGEGPDFCAGVCQMFLHMGGVVISSVEKAGDSYILRASYCGVCCRRGPISPQEAELLCGGYEWSLNGSVWREFAPGMDYHIIRSIAQGDGECLILAHPGDKPMPEDLVGERVPLQRYDEALIEYLPVAYVIEGFVYAVRCLLECVGESRSWELLEPIMENRGREMGASLKEGQDDMLALMMSALCISIASVKKRDREEELAIGSCLLTAAPSICCKLLAAYMNAALAVEGEGRMIEHTSCIPCGDESCGIRIWQRAISEKTPLEVLQMRLAKGEISAEEYLRLHQLLTR